MMRNWLYVLFLCLLVTLNLACGKTRISIDKYYKITEDKGNYRVILYNKEHKVGVNMEFPKEPYIKTFDNHIIQVSISTGSPSNYTFFYDIETNKESPAYFNLNLFSENKVVYMEEGKLIVSDAFDKKVFYKEIKRDFSPTASPSSALEEAKFVGRNKIQIKYLVGPEYKVKQEIVDLR